MKWKNRFEGKPHSWSYFKLVKRAQQNWDVFLVSDKKIKKRVCPYFFVFKEFCFERGVLACWRIFFYSKYKKKTFINSWCHSKKKHSWSHALWYSKCMSPTNVYIKGKKLFVKWFSRERDRSINLSLSWKSFHKELLALDVHILWISKCMTPWVIFLWIASWTDESFLFILGVKENYSACKNTPFKTKLFKHEKLWTNSLIYLSNLV